MHMKNEEERKTIPRLEPEAVRAEADKLWRGDDEKCATTSIKELRVRGARITSRYQKAHEFETIQTMVLSVDPRLVSFVESASGSQCGAFLSLEGGISKVTEFDRVENHRSVSICFVPQITVHE